MNLLPPAYGWLDELRPLPRMLEEARKLYGTFEVAGPASNPLILEWAKEVGLARTYLEDGIPWCGLFMAVVAKRGGKPIVEGPLWARNWAKFGKAAEKAQLGDVLVFRRGQGSGHVGLYVGEDYGAYHAITLSTSDVSEGTNLYFTDARVRANRLDQLAAPTAAVDFNSQRITGLADPTAGRTIALTGDVTGTSGSFDGSAALSFATTLANSGVTAGTYLKVTVDAKGRVTAGSSMTSSDVTSALGYTPANKAGDSFTGSISVSGSITATGDITAYSDARLKADVETITGALDRVRKLRGVTFIADSDLRAPRSGRIQYRVAQPGEVVASGGRVMNLVDLTDVYMTFFLPETAAGKVRIGSEVRLVLDAASNIVIPAKISFVADVAQFTPKTVETESERQKLMFRVRARIDPALLQRHLDIVKTGLPGMAYVRIDPKADWPANLSNLVKE